MFVDCNYDMNTLKVVSEYEIMQINNDINEHCLYGAGMM